MNDALAWTTLVEFLLLHILFGILTYVIFQNLTDGFIENPLIKPFAVIFWPSLIIVGLILIFYN